MSSMDFFSVFQESVSSLNHDNDWLDEELDYLANVFYEEANKKDQVMGWEEPGPTVSGPSVKPPSTGSMITQRLLASRKTVLVSPTNSSLVYTSCSEDEDDSGRESSVCSAYIVSNASRNSKKVPSSAVERSRVPQVVQQSPSCTPSFSSNESAHREKFLKAVAIALVEERTAKVATTREQIAAASKQDDQVNQQRERNRYSAKQTRERQKSVFNDLKTEFIHLHRENQALKCLIVQHVKAKDAVLNGCTAVEQVPAEVWDACSSTLDGKCSNASDKKRKSNSDCCSGDRSTDTTMETPPKKQRIDEYATIPQVEIETSFPMDTVPTPMLTEEYTNELVDSDILAYCVDEQPVASPEDHAVLNTVESSKRENEFMIPNPLWVTG